MRSKLLSQENSQGKVIYKRFSEIFEKTKTYIKLLNELQLCGLIPTKEFLEKIKFDPNYVEAEETELEQSQVMETKEDMNKKEIPHKLDSLIANVKIEIEQWKKELKQYYDKMEDAPENYYLLFFSGKKLNKLNNQNFQYYLKYINSHHKVSEDTLNDFELDPVNSKKKLKQLLAFFKENINDIQQSQIKEKRIDVMEKVFQFKWNKINFVKLDKSKIHERMMIILNSKVSTNVELNQLFNCSPETTLEDIECIVFLNLHFLICRLCKTNQIERKQATLLHFELLFDGRWSQA